MNPTTPDVTTFAAKEAQRQFGRLIDTSQREPVTIERRGRAVAVVLSKHDYDQIQERLEEARTAELKVLIQEGLDSGAPISMTREEIREMIGDRMTELRAEVERGERPAPGGADSIAI